MAETGFASGRQARRSVEPLRATALELEGDMSIQPASDADVERARDIQQRIAEDGFTDGERADLAALGVLPAELDELRKEMGAPLPPGDGGVHPADALRAGADALEAGSCHAEGSSCAFDEFARLAGAVGGNTAVPPRLEIPDVTLHEGDRGRNHTTVPVRLSHPASGYVSASITGELPEGVTIAPDSSFLFAARTVRSVAGFEVANDDTEGPTRTAEARGHRQAGAAEPPDPFTVTVIDDDEDGTPETRPGANGRLAFSYGRPRGRSTSPSRPEPTSSPCSRAPITTSSSPRDGRPTGASCSCTAGRHGSDDQAGGRPYYALPVGKDARPNGAKVRLTPPGTGLYEGASWSRDGKWLSFSISPRLTWTLRCSASAPTPRRSAR